LKQQGLIISDSLFTAGDLTQRSGYQCASMLLDLPNPPTAIAACNDLMALGAMSAAHERGLVIGKDIAITGFDDIPQSEHSHPPLTTVHQPIYKIGWIVCGMLIKHIQGETLEQEHVILTPSLVIRQSCGEDQELAAMTTIAGHISGA
jgi:LacI family transcriptional regulator